MRVLFDQGTPTPLRQYLNEHDVTTAYERGWATLRNGELLNAAEVDGYDVFVTTDSHIKYQQNLGDRKLAIVVLLTTSWPRIEKAVDSVIETVNEATPGSYAEVKIPV